MFFQALLPTLPASFISILQIEGLGDCDLCLDAGDRGSFASSSDQQWTDMSGNGHHYYRGSGSGSDAADPTFNGTVGLVSEAEYFSFDGGDYFTEVASQSWADTWHDQNGKFSIVALVRFPSTSGLHTIFSSQDGQSDPGVQFLQNASNLTLRVREQDAVLDESMTANITASTLAFCAVAVDEANSVVRFALNSTVETLSVAYGTSASVGSAGAYGIGATGNGGNKLASGSRLYALAAWNGLTLTSTQLGSLYTRLKQRRFTSLP